MNHSKSILMSKTAWFFAIMLIVGLLKAAGVVALELTDSEAEGIALGIAAIVGIILRLISNGRVYVLPVEV